MEAQRFNSNLCDDCQGIFRGVKKIWVDDNSDWQFYPHFEQSQKSWVKKITSKISPRTS
jgi:hypothetical protein